MLMNTYCACIECQNKQESVISWIDENCTVEKARFFYKEVAANHYIYRGSVGTPNRWGHNKEQTKVSVLKKPGYKTQGKSRFCILHYNHRSECIPCHGTIPWQSRRFFLTSKGIDS